jgi:GNAT superfamily N-acetyltransferase
MPVPAEPILSLIFAVMQIRRAVEADAAQISRLIHELSYLFALSPDGEDADQFFAATSQEAIRGNIIAKNFSCLVAEENNQLVGVAAIRDQRHLFHLFVAPVFQKRGLGRLLWSMVRDIALESGNAGEFTVNSSPNAVPVYERFGFTATGPRIEAYGVAFTPMKLSVGIKSDNAVLSIDAQARK